jgi:hypothetical protein
VELQRHPDGGFTLHGLRQADIGALRAVASEADPSGIQAAEFRLYPDPVLEGDDEGACQDWSEFVEPQLREAFAGALQTLAGDLATATASGSPRRFRVDVPASHRDAWCSALNQARLVMHERYGFPDSDDPVSLFKVLTGDHAEAFARSRLYAALLEWIVGTFR